LGGGAKVPSVDWFPFENLCFAFYCNFMQLPS
jgi:hypothetical protein